MNKSTRMFVTGVAIGVLLTYIYENMMVSKVVPTT